ncbi:PREDICTED: TOX high mobility group box family member 3-like isoform X1 [Branchiostoma belcheri]|uniref:TOX high mobility group box family member 3-like isoform X1 n=1 Tax=Branchiostoma belcheri TaxID=7741 RepID=A0A6P4ZQ33_BRABE|nr:PREDICTED: TOX high mobility group box family member 3-like isoform X1 [Branchiostoma belcheri]
MDGRHRHRGGGNVLFWGAAGAGQLSRTQRMQRQFGFMAFMLLFPGITLTVMNCCETHGPAIAGYCSLGAAGFFMIVTFVLWYKAREEARTNVTATQAQQVGGLTVQQDGTTMHGLTVVGLQQQQQQQQQLQQLQQNPQLQQMMATLLNQQMQNPQFRQQHQDMMSNPQYQQVMSNLAQQNPQLQETMPSVGQQSAGQPYPGSQPYPGTSAAGGFAAAPSAPPSAQPPQYGFTYNTSDNYNTQYSSGTSDLPPPPAYSTVVNEKL